ncbi:Tll0287-like domain-containing protein [Methylophaga sp.]|uniref:Tll0287-like domain-containing protein n=1 Tax=Methylophaga sp. TaxID=2024840 RepID=UPI003F6A114E
MKSLAFTSILIGLLSFTVHAQTTEQQQFETKAQAAIKEFGSSLKASLMSAMQDGGPIEAVAVCNLIAPTLAAEMSKKYGMDIGRTSLKVRNPDNEADEWETSVMQDFETRLSTGEAIQSLTFSEKVATDIGHQWRMMKAIPTDKVCLSCHGTKIAPPIQKKLNKYYPDDMATGYKLRDIRGAFTVSKEAD